MKNRKDNICQCTIQQNASTFQLPNADTSEEERRELESLLGLFDNILLVLYIYRNQ